MNNIESKKISVIMILISIIGMVIGYSIKQPFYKGKYHREKISTPLHRYFIDFFGYNVSYKYLLISLLILLGIAIYCFLFKKDEEIEKSIIIFKNSLKKFINSSIFKKITTQIKDFYLLGNSNKILRIEKGEVKEYNEVKKTFFKRLFSYNGRIRRTEYLISFTIFLVLYVAMDRIILTGINPIIMLAYIPLLWFLLAQGAKRCHDIGNSGWYQIIPFYFIWLLFAESSVEANQYGLNPKECGNKDELNQNEFMNKIYRILGIIMLIFFSVVILNKLLKNEIINKDTFVSEETREVENAKLDLKESARKMNDLLPMTIDNYTTATKVEYLSNESKFVSYFEVNGVTNEDFDQKAIDDFKETQRLKNIKLLKGNPVKNKSFVTAKTTIESIYKFTNGVVLCSYKIYPNEYSN